MKKYLGIIIGIGFVFSSLIPSQVQAQSFNDEQLAIVATALVASGDYSPEQIVQIMIALSSLSATSLPNQSDVILAANEVCAFRYNGDDSITAIQQELQNQGYTITKIDGKIGPETRAAVTALQTDNNAMKIDGLIGDETRILLAKNSVRCEINSTPITTQSENGDTDTDTDTEIIDTTETIVEPTPQEPVIEDTTNTNIDTEIDDFLIKDEILAAVRSTGLVADDTAVFTYRLTLNPDTALSVSTNSEIAFAINIYNEQGTLVNVDQATSIVSTGERVGRTDGSSQYRITNGDSISLRSTSQPGPGTYYAELGRFTYAEFTNENSVNPSLINYELQDSTNWRSGTITLQN